MESFLGGNIRNTQLEGLSIEKFIVALDDKIFIQAFEPLSFILGRKYLLMGLWK